MRNTRREAVFTLHRYRLFGYKTLRYKMLILFLAMCLIGAQARRRISRDRKRFNKRTIENHENNTCTPETKPTINAECKDDVWQFDALNDVIITPLQVPIASFYLRSVHQLGFTTTGSMNFTSACIDLVLSGSILIVLEEVPTEPVRKTFISWSDSNCPSTIALERVHAQFFDDKGIDCYKLDATYELIDRSLVISVTADDSGCNKIPQYVLWISVVVGIIILVMIITAFILLCDRRNHSSNIRGAFVSKIQNQLSTSTTTTAAVMTQDEESSERKGSGLLAYDWQS